MAYFSFTKDILSGNPIKVFNMVKWKRLTYIDDVVEGIVKLIDRIRRLMKTGMKLKMT